MKRICFLICVALVAVGVTAHAAVTAVEKNGEVILLDGAPAGITAASGMIAISGLGSADAATARAIVIREKPGDDVMLLINDKGTPWYIDNMYAEVPYGPYMSYDFSDRSFGFSPGRSNGFKARLMVMYRLVDELDLDEDTATQFFPVYLAHINKRDKLMKEHRELTMKIAEDSENEAVTVATLKANVGKLRDFEKTIDSERDTFLAKAEKILEGRQYIKLIVFNDKLKEDLISRYRSSRIHRTNTERLQREMQENSEVLKKESIKKK